MKKILKKKIVSSDGQDIPKPTYQDAVRALNYELAKYPKGERIEVIQFKIEEKNGQFKAICEYSVEA